MHTAFEVTTLLPAIFPARKKIVCVCVYIHSKHFLYNDKILEKSK